MSGFVGRALGLDLGTDRIGVAISDDDQTVATPLEVIPAANRESADQRIGELVDEWEPGVIVVGLPLQLDGESGSAAVSYTHLTLPTIYSV